MTQITLIIKDFIIMSDENPGFLRFQTLDHIGTCNLLKVSLESNLSGNIVSKTIYINKTREKVTHT